MIPYVPSAFFARRERIAKLLNNPVELTGIYHVLQPAGYSFAIGRMLKPHLQWEAKHYVSLGYNATNLVGLDTVKEFFDISRSIRGTFYIDRLPGCCGAAHVHDIYSANVGMGSICLELAEQGAYDAGYRLITGTIINSRASYLIDKYGWTKHRPWVNKRTANTVYLCSKELTADNAGRRSNDGTSKSSNQSGGVQVATVARTAGFST